MKRRLSTLERSFAWIALHPLATNLDVPDDLLNEWLLDEEVDAQRHPGFCLAVFSFGYIQRTLLSDGLPPDEKRSVPAERLLQCFSSWQVKLALAKTKDCAAIELRALPLFAFPADDPLSEAVEFWHNPHTPGRPRPETS